MSLGKTSCLEVHVGDDELVEVHGEEITTEESQLLLEHQNMEEVMELAKKECVSEVA